MNARELDRQIKLRLGVLSLKEKLAILGVLKAFFVKKIDRKVKDIESDKDKGVTLEQSKKRIARKLNKKNLMPDDGVLEEVKGKVLFKDKVAKANETLKTVGLPKTKKKKPVSR